MKLSNGFTLIEVLVAVVIMAVGLLGLAGLQISGLRNNLSAEHKSKAAQLVYDMSDRIRANVSPTSLVIYSAGVSEANIGCDASTLCTSAQLAQDDLFNWVTDIGNDLPNGTPIISSVGGAFTVGVSWYDNADTSNSRFQVNFQP